VTSPSGSTTRSSNTGTRCQAENEGKLILRFCGQDRCALWACSSTSLCAGARASCGHCSPSPHRPAGPPLHGRVAPQCNTRTKEAGYHQQACAENVFFRYKSLFGSRLGARGPAGLLVEALIGVEISNRPHDLCCAYFAPGELMRTRLPLGLLRPFPVIVQQGCLEASVTLVCRTENHPPTR
jgi:hypothetical protein